MKKILGLVLAIGIFVGGLGVNSNAIGGYSQNDVTVRSGMSVDRIRDLLPPRMKELAPIYYEIENSNKPINAMFLMSVTRLETGNGTSYSYRVKNNTGGVMGRRGTRYFNSKADCLRYMQDFLYRGYINQGRRSVWRIGSKYCVGGNWAGKVNRMSINTMYRNYNMR